MTESMVRTERRGRVLEVTLDRPPVNAINRETSRAIYAALRTLQDDPTLSVGLLTGAGERVFSAGWDLKEAAAEGFDPDLDDHPEKGFGPGGFAGLTEFWDLLKPVVAAVNGAAVGGGLELAISCDVVIMAEQAHFALPEMQRGFLADAGAVQKLPKLLPYNVAREMLLTGRRMYAEEAVRWGLVHRAVRRDALLPTAREVAQQIAGGAPLALQALKEVMQHTNGLSMREAMDAVKFGRPSGLSNYDRLATSEDAVEGTVAFAEKREPVWKGR